MAELEAQHDIAPEDIIAIYHRAIGESLMDENCYVNAPDAVLRLARNIIAALAPGKPSRKILQVGIDDKDGRRFWGWVKGDDVTYHMGKYKTKWGFHFMLVNGEGQPIYNPDPRITGERVALVLYRRF